MRSLLALLLACLWAPLLPVSAASAGGDLLPVLISPHNPRTSTVGPAPGMFLVARRTLQDSHFRQSVVYLLEHDKHGTAGLIVNRPSHIRLSEAVAEIDEAAASRHALYYGGPVGVSQITMLLRNEAAAPLLTPVDGDVFVSANRQVLERLLAAGKPQNELHFYLGHAGWAPGQLDFELVHKHWHLVTGDADAIFASDIDSLWKRLIQRLEPLGIQVKADTPSRFF